MEAFAAAVALGYRWVETDAHVTADGVVVAFHDDRLDRVTDRTGAVADLPWSEVARARIDGRAPIPRLDELLTAWPDLRVNIDPKHDAVVDPLAELLERTGTLDRVCVGSFSDRRLERLRSRFSDRLCTSMGPRQIAALRVASLGIPIRPGPADCVQVPVATRGVTIVDRRFIARCHRSSLAVHVWTIDDPAEMERLLDLGVDGIMTDRPTVLRDVLTRRGCWP